MTEEEQAYEGAAALLAEAEEQYAEAQDNVDRIELALKDQWAEADGRLSRVEQEDRLTKERVTDDSALRVAVLTVRRFKTVVTKARARRDNMKNRAYRSSELGRG
jgi:hypothetical protein